MKQRLDVLTALRFPAAMLVFLHHVEGHFGVPLDLFPLRRFFVSCFFCLSGFLLYLIYSRPDRPFSTASFYSRRLTRIYPLHLAVFLIAFGLFWSQEIYLLNTDMSARLMNLGLRATLLQCWYPKPEFMAYGGVTWSLSVLIFFYVSFPLLLQCKKHLWLVLISVLGVGLAFLWAVCCNPDFPVFGSIDPNDIVHYFPPFRLAEFILGMIFAQCYSKGWAKPVAGNFAVASLIDVGLLLACIYGWPIVEQFVRQELDISRAQQVFNAARDLAVTSDTAREISAEYSQSVFRFALYRWFLYAGYCIPGAAIIYWFSCSTGALARSLESSVFVFLGNLSFALFLCHRPLILWLEPLIAPMGITPAMALVLCTSLVLSVSVLLYYWIELPSANLFRRTPVGKKTSPQNKPPRAIGNEIGGWLLIASCMLAFVALQSKLPAVNHVEFSNGLTTYPGAVVPQGGFLTFSLSWRADQTLNGDLWAIHAAETGEYVGRIKVAAFGDEDALESQAGFKVVRISLNGKEPFGLVKLVFVDRETRPPASFRDANPWNAASSTIWSRKQLPSTEFGFQNGLVVIIDRVEMHNDVLVVNVHWSSPEANDGSLFFRQLDANNEPVRFQTANNFSIDDSTDCLTGRKQFFFNFQDFPKTQTIDLSFGRKGKGLVLLESKKLKDRRRIFIWNRK